MCAAVDRVAAEAAEKRGSSGGKGAGRVNSFLVLRSGGFGVQPIAAVKFL